MSVIQETITAFTENANQFDRAGLPQAARALRQRAASLSEYADITEARAAGFATVEEMCAQMGRQSDLSIPDFLNALHGKAAKYDEIAEMFAADEHFATQWKGDAVWYAEELLAEYNDIGDVVQEHGDIGEEFGTGDIAEAVKRRFAAIPIADLDKYTIKDGEVVPSGTAAPPPSAEVVALRIHEELDDQPPPPSDAQRCTAHLMNYLDAKFEESSRLQRSLDEESLTRDQRILDRVPATELSGRDFAFLVVWTLSIAAITAMVFQL